MMETQESQNPGSMPKQGPHGVFGQEVITDSTELRQILLLTSRVTETAKRRLWKARDEVAGQERLLSMARTQLAAAERDYDEQLGMLVEQWEYFCVEHGWHRERRAAAPEPS